ncbi:MAG: hypothetical protein WCP06_03050 [Verrucomicrobiota bacterium]
MSEDETNRLRELIDDRRVERDALVRDGLAAVENAVNERAVRLLVALIGFGAAHVGVIVAAIWMAASWKVGIERGVSKASHDRWTGTMTELWATRTAGQSVGFKPADARVIQRDYSN